MVVLTFRKIMNVTITYSGRENVPSAGSIIFAAKHQSYADRYSLWLQGLNARFVLGKFTADENGGVKAFRDFKSQVDALG